MTESLTAAREAATRHAWREAYVGYGNANDVGLTPEDLEHFGDAAWWTGKLDEAIDLRERAYARFAADGDRLGASRLALTLFWDHLNRGEFAVAQGWFANAERLVDGMPESSEHARVLISRAFMALFVEGDLDAASDRFEQAQAIAGQVRDRDSEVLAQVGKGRTLIQKGEVDQGLALLDQATAAAVCGELRPFATGLAYCITITSCQNVGDYRRAAEWTEAANRWCDRLDVSGFPGACRVHRAEVMRLRGDWTSAEAQALTACEELHDFDRHVTAGGYYEIGEIRRRRGDFSGAEEAYRTATELGRAPQPGLALLRLAEGKVESALAGIATALEEMVDPLSRVHALPVQAEIAAAAGDLRAARGATEELERIVDSYTIRGARAPAFEASVQLVSGRIKLAEKDWEGAVSHLRRARDEWQRVGAPYETAQARMLLATGLRRRGDEHAASVELEAALATFERLGAAPDAERANELLGRLETRRTFLFTDIVDSTKLLATLGDEKWKKLLARHDQLVQERIVDGAGEVVKKTGDGFFASFDNPRVAIEAAVAIQRALDAEIVAPDVRIGVHSGGAFRKDAETLDYGGQGVHLAARIGSAAGAAEILVSAETIDGLPTTFRVSEPRTELLKGFEKPVDVVSVDWR